MEKLDRFLDKMVTYASGHLSGWLVIIMTILVMVEVVSRYVLRQPLMIADEFSGYILAVMTFTGLAYTWKEKGHIRIEVLFSRLPHRAALWLRAVVLLGIVAFMPILAKALLDLTLYSIQWDMRSASWLRFPVVWPQMLMFLGAVIFYIMLIVGFIKAMVAAWTGKGDQI